MAKSTVRVERPRAEHALHGIPADSLHTLRFGLSTNTERIVAENVIAVLAPTVADRRASLRALIHPVSNEERQRLQHLICRRGRIIGKLAIRGDGPLVANLVADGDIPHLGLRSARLGGDLPDTFLDREAVSDRTDRGHLHGHRSLGKLFEEGLEERGDLGPAGVDVAILVNEFTLLHEEGRHAGRIGGVEGLDGGLHLAADHRGELGRGSHIGWPSSGHVRGLRRHDH